MSTAAVEFLDVTKRFGAVTAVDHVSLNIQDGEFFALLGPSGCGKTTTLRMIAGFALPTAGHIRLHGQEIGLTPPFKRPVNTVFQNYALFPHMSVQENVAFGLQMRKVARAEIDRRVEQALEMVRLPGFGSRRPRQLSGGQQQRVALARALINRPAVLLLDEPLGALDLKLRKEMQLELKHLQHQVGITFIYVTHDQEEALTMSDRIAVMNQGQVLQVGTPREIYEHPTTRFVADFIGETNFLSGVVQVPGERATVLIDDQAPVQVTADGLELTVGQRVTLSIRPEKASVLPVGDALTSEAEVVLEKMGLRRAGRHSAFAPGTGHHVLLPGRIREVFYLGTDTRYVVSLTDKSDIVVRYQNFGTRYDLTSFREGDEVQVHWVAENARLLQD